MTVLRNDKVILIKEFGELRLVGSVFEVASVTEKSIVLRDVTSKIAVGSIGIDDFEKYFAKGIKGWTDWSVINNIEGDLIGTYKTNGKQVKVKAINGEKSKATCYKDDEFNLSTGIRIALYRCFKKSFDRKINELNKQIERLDDERSMYVKMINSLSK